MRRWREEMAGMAVALREREAAAAALEEELERSAGSRSLNRAMYTR